MTMDNLNKEITETPAPIETPPENETPKSAAVVESPYEQAARQSGWVPKEDWIAQGKNPDDWRSAREYQERGELFEEIHKLKDSNKKTSAAFRALVEHHKKVRESAVKEALEKLKQEKRQALENHEIGRVFEIDDEIERVQAHKADLPEIDIPEPEVGPTPAFKAWHKKNNWYELSGDDEASRYADVIGAQYKQKNPNATEEMLLEHVESRIARRFPELFENPNSKRPSEVNPSSEGSPQQASGFKLTEAEERVCKMLIEQGAMTRKEYIDELKKTRGV